MKPLREKTSKSHGVSDDVNVKEYDHLNMNDKRDGHVEKHDFPTTSNVLQFFTADGSKISIRPSGTEPKIKFYIEVKGHMATKADYHAATEAAEKKIAAIKKELGI